MRNPGIATRAPAVPHTLAWAALLLCTTAATAMASPLSYYVATQALATAGSGGPFGQSEYNFNVLGNLAPVGSTIQTGNCVSGCTVGASGTNTSNALLTSSSNSANASTVSPGFSASATAGANLATGSIGAYANGQGQLFGNQGGVASAVAYLQDELTFNGLPAGVTDIGVTFEVHGSLSASPTAGNASMRATDYFGNANIDTIVQDQSQTGYTPALDYFHPLGWVSYTVSDSNVGDIIFHGEYAVDSTDPTVGIALYLTAGGLFDATSDYGDTDGVTLSLPSGVTFTSASNVFLTQAPEPAGWTLLLSALGMLGFTLRRRRRTAG